MTEITEKRDGVLKCVVGLGNPGTEYSGTRHNLGWLALDEIIAELGERKNFNARGNYRFQVLKSDEVGIVLVRPSTFMNLSGKAVKNCLDFYGLTAADLLVIHDEMDIEQGWAKMRMGGGAGGHRGVDSVIGAIGTSEFLRIKIGIGRPELDEAGADPDWVLGKISEEELATYEKIIELIPESVKIWVNESADKAMTWFNTEVRKLNKNGDDPNPMEEDVEQE